MKHYCMYMGIMVKISALTEDKIKENQWGKKKKKEPQTKMKANLTESS